MADVLSSEGVAAALERLPGWTADGTASISKTFSFGDHIEAMGFVVRVGMAAEVADHHPDLRIVYSTVDITLSTHDAGGVTEKDVALAAQADRLSG